MDINVNKNKFYLYKIKELTIYSMKNWSTLTMCILMPQVYEWVATILQTEWTYWVTGQYCTSWLELASFRGSRLGTGSKPKPDDGLDGDLRCRHTPPSAHRKPVIFAHSLIWSCNTHICPIRHMPVNKRK